MVKSKKKELTMEQVTANYETFIKDKKQNPKGKELFEKALKKAVKQRGSK